MCTASLCVVKIDIYFDCSMKKNDVYIVYSCQHCPLWKIHLKCWNIFTRVYSVNVYIKKPLQKSTDNLFSYQIVNNYSLQIKAFHNSTCWMLFRISPTSVAVVNRMGVHRPSPLCSHCEVRIERYYWATCNVTAKGKVHIKRHTPNWSPETDNG